MDDGNARHDRAFLPDRFLLVSLTSPQHIGVARDLKLWGRMLDGRRCVPDQCQLGRPLLQMPDLFTDGFADGGGYCSGKLSLKDVENAGQGTAHLAALFPLTPLAKDLLPKGHTLLGGHLLFVFL